MLAVDASKTGQVTCVAQHVRNGGVTIASSTANAIVLTNNFQTELIRQEGKIVLRGELSHSIPGVFSLVIRFFKSPNNFEESIVFDPSLTDTKNINIQIPREKLPNSFKEFHVQVALKVGDALGPFSPASNQISYDNSDEGCMCGTLSPNDESPSSASVSNTIVVAVIVVLIALVALAIVVLVVGCVFLYNKKVNLEKAYYISSHASHGSLHRCASRTSCASHGSRKSERSYKSSSSSVSSSSHGSSRGVDNNDIELGVIQETGEVATYENMHKVKDEKDGPKDVRDFETMDHRALKQREELRANIRTSLDQRAGVPTAVREPEPVYPKTHIGAINPIPFRQGHRNRQRQGRDSGSSFEDLEEDFMEITHKSF